MLIRNALLSSFVTVIGLNLWPSVLATPMESSNATDVDLFRRAAFLDPFGAWFGDIYWIVKKFGGKIPWDTKSGNCVIEVKEAKGGHCVGASSPAGEPAYTTYDNWNVCYLNGQQHFNFPDAPGRPGIGNVIIEYTGKDCSFEDNGGYYMQGLCKPQLTLLNHDPKIVIDMWRSMGNENDNSNTCHFEVFDNYWNSWKCGVPCRNDDSTHQRST